MGRERAVICWEVRQQALLDELRLVEQALAEAQARGGPAPAPAGAAGIKTLQAQALRARLHALGPSPKAKMG